MPPVAQAHLHRSLQDAYEAHQRQWRADHPLVPATVWTPESIGLPPRDPLPQALAENDYLGPVSI